MSEFLQVQTTTGSRKEADHISASLIDQRLAACVQIVGPIKSVYHWQGAVESGEEWLCLIKTTKEALPKVEGALKQLHSYDCPEIIALPIVGGSSDYLTWLRSELQ